MEVEYRYHVAKKKDVEAYLTVAEQATLTALLTKIGAGRVAAGRANLDALVIEHDWPIYSPVKSHLFDLVEASSLVLPPCGVRWRGWDALVLRAMHTQNGTEIRAGDTVVIKGCDKNGKLRLHVPAKTVSGIDPARVMLLNTIPF